MKPMKICLWFAEEALEAARFYVSLFPDGKIGEINYFNKEGFETHHRPEGSVWTVEFHANGTDFIALNGGPVFQFDEAVSLVVTCETQEEIDHYWSALMEGGGTESECGWLKDRFGLSWQVVPDGLFEMLRAPEISQRERVTSALMNMKKFNIKALQEAFRG